jgi:5-methylcytosine-specific restriction protein A
MTAMTWTGDPRTTTPQWRATRRRILDRDMGRCHVCGAYGADQVDHVVSLKEGGSDSDDNLAAIHRHPCHARKSSLEGNRAKARYPTRRPVEKHPGLL